MSQRASTPAADASRKKSADCRDYTCQVLGSKSHTKEKKIGFQQPQEYSHLSLLRIFGFSAIST